MVPRALTLVRAFLANEITWLFVYVIIAVIATGICAGRQCNNFLIFRSAFDHLLAGRDLYAAYPAEHADLFKYSPTFALLFAPFALLPFGIALYMFAVNPDYIGLLFKTTYGIIMLIVAGALLVAGVLWMKKIVDIDV